MQGWQQTLSQHKAHIAVPHSTGQQPHSGKAPQHQQAGRTMLPLQHSTVQELLNRKGPDMPTSRVASTGTAYAHAFRPLMPSLACCQNTSESHQCRLNENSCICMPCITCTWELSPVFLSSLPCSESYCPVQLCLNSRCIGQLHLQT